MNLFPCLRNPFLASHYKVKLFFLAFPYLGKNRQNRWFHLALLDKIRHRRSVKRPVGLED